MREEKEKCGKREMREKRRNKIGDKEVRKMRQERGGGN